MGFSDANYHFNEAPTLSINSKTVSESNRPADQDILESIEAAYFSLDENYDICRFELGVSQKIMIATFTHPNSCRNYQKL